MVIFLIINCIQRINSLQTGNYCDRNHNNFYCPLITRSSKEIFSRDSEVNTSESLENQEKMFPLYYIYMHT